MPGAKNVFTSGKESQMLLLPTSLHISEVGLISEMWQLHT